jgi:formylmethanofuran dehydrogenase subunit E
MDIIDTGKEANPLSLPKGEMYHIKTIEDLVNCPINMYKEATHLIATAWAERLEVMEKTRKVHDITNCTLSVTNDGVDETYVDINILKKEDKYIKLVCTKCGSDNMGTYKMPTGKIFCSDCQHVVIAHKERIKLEVIDGKYHQIVGE